MFYYRAGVTKEKKFDANLKHVQRSYALMINDKRLSVTSRSFRLDLMRWRAAHKLAAKQEEDDNCKTAGTMTQENVFKYATQYD